MTHDEIVKYVDDLYECTGVGDFDRAETMLTDDFFITEADSLPFAGVYRGKTALRELYTKVMGMMFACCRSNLPILRSSPPIWLRFLGSATARRAKSSPIILIRRRLSRPARANNPLPKQPLRRLDQPPERCHEPGPCRAINRAVID
jgi:hypothetical protein